MRSANGISVTLAGVGGRTGCDTDFDFAVLRMDEVARCSGLSS
jgi:hypothetical protein